MKYLNFIILSCLVLLSYTSSSYGFSNSKDWCLPQNKYQRNIPFHKLEDGNKCPSNTYSITDKRALKILLFDYGGYINKIIESGDICNDTYKNYSYLRALIKDKKNLDCKKILQNLADKKVKEALNIALAQKKVEEEALKKTLAEKKAEEESKIRALAEKLAKEEIARQLKVKQKEEEAKQKALATKKAKEDAARKKALAKKKAEKLAKQKAIAAKKAKEDKARKKALAKEKAEELAKQKAIAAKKTEEEELKQRVLNEKIQKIKDEAKFVVATLKEYVTTDTNKLDILEVSELLENYNNEMQKGWTDTTVEKYEELYDYVQKDEGFIEFSADKKSKQLAAYNEEIIQLREYLTTSQSGLKSFITKNLGSNNAKKALKLAKETKQILKDFEVNQAMTLKNNISTWKAMNGVAENKKYTFKILNKKTETIKQSATKQVAQNKPTATKSLSKVSAKVDTSKDYKIGDYPEFLKGKYWFYSKEVKKSGLKCDEVLKRSNERLYFVDYRETKMIVYSRDKMAKFSKNSNDINKERKYKASYSMTEGDKFQFVHNHYRIDDKEGECKFSFGEQYNSESENILRNTCKKVECSKTGKQNKWMADGAEWNCSRKGSVRHWCSGKPKEVTFESDWVNYTHYTFSNKQGYNSKLRRTEKGINCHYENGEVATIGMYLWQTKGCTRQLFRPKN
jgi:hypothetical protein